MGAGVMFQKDGKALLLKRSKRNKDRWGGYWNSPEELPKWEKHLTKLPLEKAEKK